MKGLNLLIGVLCFHLNIVHGNSQVLESNAGAVANEMCKKYTEDAKKNNFCPVPLDIRIIRGNVAAKGEFPHMVQLAYIKNNETKYLCSGFIISKNYVLTSTQCVTGEGADQPEFVRAGVTDDKDVTNEQIRSIHTILALLYIALIRVKEDFNFNKFVSPACLYTSNENPDGPGIHTGWHPTDIGEDKQTNMVQLFLNFDSNESCNNTLVPTEKGVLPEAIVKNKIVCAGGKTTDGCQIDSGSPLQIDRKDSNEESCMYYAVGVSSFGSRVCGKKELPAAFIRISYYIKWIVNNVWPPANRRIRFF
ncbi:elastase-1-like isoform X1 [Diabrotica undecimpunctata]|uniref:elastase-1-like isoform X1 n=1 Tax=Diabrotica undecimpunctata TaxID=50387 RepID=UPI003B63E22F